MRPNDKKVFLQVAGELKLWILVRRTNPASLPYIGRVGYAPKRIDCKAKTADRDVGSARIAGLVVDPTVQPNAFSVNKLEKAISEWRRYSASMLAAGYTVDTKNASTLGLVSWRGMYLYGDYDLYDIIDPNAPSRNLASVESLHGQSHSRGAHFIKVQNLINSRIGVPMIQHGGEMQFTNHSDQPIDAFGPDGEDVTILNEYSVRAWYQERFSGRKSLGGSDKW